MNKLFEHSLNHIGRVWLACGSAAILLSFPLAAQETDEAQAAATQETDQAQAEADEKSKLLFVEEVMVDGTRMSLEIALENKRNGSSYLEGS